MTWFLSTRIGRWLSMIGAFLALLIGAVFVGWTKRGQQEANKALKGYQDKRKEMDREDYLDSDDVAIIERLRERGKR